MIFLFIVIAVIVLVIFIKIGLHADTFVKWFKAFFIGLLILLVLALLIWGIILILKALKPDLFI